MDRERKQYLIVINKLTTMKKILIAILAVAGLAACSQDMTLETPKGAAIAFDNAFVNNSTRATDITADNLQDFGVYGSVVNNQNQQGLIFNNQEVKKNGNAYSYSPAQYWIADAQYDFVAIAPYQENGDDKTPTWTYATTTEDDAKNGTLTFYNDRAAANQDLLFDSAARTTQDITSKPDAVSFTFNHLLSRVKFTFVNGFASGSNITLKITDVHITDTYKSGTIAIANGAVADTWTAADNTLNVDFNDAGTEFLAEAGGKASTEHHYLIPAKATYNITFNVELKQAGVSVGNYSRTATVNALNLQKGQSYELKATLNQNNTSDEGQLYPIEFSVNSVENWQPYDANNGEGWIEEDATVNQGSNN